MALLLAAPALAKVDAVDGYVRLLPPGSPNTAAFMVLRNDGDKPVKLVAGASPEAGRVELHTHLHENGVMKMRQVESIEIPAKGEAVLKPGSLHVMLIGLKQDLKEGDVVPITLKLDDGSSTKIEAPVRKIQVQAAKPEDMGHQGHGAMKH